MYELSVLKFYHFEKGEMSIIDKFYSGHPSTSRATRNTRSEKMKLTLQYPTDLTKFPSEFSIVQNWKSYIIGVPRIFSSQFNLILKTNE